MDHRKSDFASVVRMHRLHYFLFVFWTCSTMPQGTSWFLLREAELLHLFLMKLQQAGVGCAVRDVIKGMDDEYELICALITMHGEVVPRDGWTNMLNTTQSNQTIAMSNSQQPSTKLGRCGIFRACKMYSSHWGRFYSPTVMQSPRQLGFVDSMIKQVCRANLTMTEAENLL